MLVCAFLCASCTRDRGCSAHPVFPAPSVPGRDKVMQSSGENAPRDRGGLTLETELHPSPSSWTSERSERDLRCAIAHRGTHTPRRMLSWQMVAGFLQQLATVVMGPCAPAQLRTRQGRPLSHDL